MKYSVEVYIPGKEKYSGDFDGLSVESATRKVNGNIRVTGEWGISLRNSEVAEEISEMKADDKLIFWCDDVHGAYAMVKSYE